MNAAQTLFATLKWVTCCHEGCGVSFGLEAGFESHRRADKKAFYCPNGHRQGFFGENEADVLKKELENKKKQLEWAEDRAKRNREWAEREQRSAIAYKGVATKIRKRAHHGVCPHPDCRRSFANLREHMKTKHPDWKKDDV